MEESQTRQWVFNRFEPPSVVFDGFRFATSGYAMNLPVLEMAYRARRGDSAAAELLDKFRVRVLDFDQNPYWPMVTAEEEFS